MRVIRDIAASLLISALNALFVACSSPGEGVKSSAPPIENFRVVVEGKVYAGARPGSEGLRWLDSRGIKTIVNLERELFERTPGEVKKERSMTEELDIRSIHIPLHPFFSPMLEELDKAVAAMTDPDNQPVFVHCDQGDDRTGMVIAAYRIKVQGWSPKEAYQEMKQHGFHELIYFWWKDQLFNYARKARGQSHPLHPEEDSEEANGYRCHSQS